MPWLSTVLSLWKGNPGSARFVAAVLRTTEPIQAAGPAGWVDSLGDCVEPGQHRLQQGWGGVGTVKSNVAGLRWDSMWVSSFWMELH